MIKIIKQGHPEQIIKKFKCHVCGCEWVASEDETVRAFCKNSTVWQMRCPCCKRMTSSTDSI